MSVQVNGINVIDDDRNFSAAGIVTVGTGNSATIIDGTTGITSVGIGITMEGVPGNISIAGTLTAAGFNIPASIVSFSPANGATNVNFVSPIVIIFDQSIGVGTEGYIYLREGSAGGTTIETFGVNDVTITNSKTLTISKSPAGFGTDIYVVMEKGFIQSTSGNFVGLNTTGADSYSFQVEDPLGTFYEGGYLICQASTVQWIVAPSSAQVSRTWYDRNDAITVAQQVSGCTGWFIPSISQRQNPGYVCRAYWDSYSGGWTNQSERGGDSYQVNNNSVSIAPNQFPKNVRAFRTVTY